MAKRTKLLAIGGASAVGSLLIGSDAFSSVQAERAVEVNVVGDEAAYLALEPAQGPNGQYARTDDGVLEVDLSETGAVAGDGVNPSAVTRVEEVFVVRNQGTQEVGVWFEDDSTEVTFTINGSEAESEANAVLLAPGESSTVGLLIDSTNASADETLLESVTIHADADVERRSSGGTGDGGADQAVNANRTVRQSEDEVTVTLEVTLPSRTDVDTYVRYDAGLGPSTVESVTVSGTSVVPLFSDFDAGGGILLLDEVGPGTVGLVYTIDTSGADDGSYTLEATTVDAGSVTETTSSTAVTIGGE